MISPVRLVVVVLPALPVIPMTGAGHRSRNSCASFDKGIRRARGFHHNRRIQWNARPIGTTGLHHPAGSRGVRPVQIPRREIRQSRWLTFRHFGCRSPAPVRQSSAASAPALYPAVQIPARQLFCQTIYRLYGCHSHSLRIQLSEVTYHLWKNRYRLFAAFQPRCLSLVAESGWLTAITMPAPRRSSPPANPLTRSAGPSASRSIHRVQNGGAVEPYGTIACPRCA